MKLWSKLAGLLVAVLVAGCKPEMIEPENVDKDYNITYYGQPPHSQEQQGYLHVRGDGERDFYELSSSNQPPYTLFIMVTDNRGQNALDFILQKENSPIQRVKNLSTDANGTKKTYLVETTKYFQTSSFYTSEMYQLVGISSGYSISVLPVITVKMNAGQDIRTLTDRYGSAISLAEEADDNVYVLNCSYKTSYEVLMVTIDMNNMDEVAWAEATLTGVTGYPTNK